MDKLIKILNEELIHTICNLGTSLTKYGITKAKHVKWKHRLSELSKQTSSWIQEHQIGIQLGRNPCKLWIQNTDKFLGCPMFHLHGEPIPTAKGILSPIALTPLINLEAP